jgi:hypothetical protein
VRAGVDRLYVRPAPEFLADGAALLFELERLLRALPEVIVAGIPTVARAIVAREKDRNQVLIEGTNLQVGGRRPARFPNSRIGASGGWRGASGQLVGVVQSVLPKAAWASGGGGPGRPRVYLPECVGPGGRARVCLRLCGGCARARPTQHRRAKGQRGGGAVEEG